MSRTSELAEVGAALDECMIIEIFAGTGRVTAALKSLGMDGAFGTDHKRHKQAASPNCAGGSYNDGRC